MPEDIGDQPVNPILARGIGINDRQSETLPPMTHLTAAQGEDTSDPSDVYLTGIQLSFSKATLLSRTNGL